MKVAGITWGTCNPEVEPLKSILKESQFEWMDLLMEDLRSGIVVDDRVPFKRVGCYVWPKTAPISTTDDAKAADGLAATSPDNASGNIEFCPGDIHLVSILMHGGGHCHKLGDSISLSKWVLFACATSLNKAKEGILTLTVLYAMFTHNPIYHVYSPSDSSRTKIRLLLLPMFAHL